MKNNIQEKYNFNQHRHNFAVWTSARACKTILQEYREKIELMDLERPTMT